MWKCGYFPVQFYFARWLFAPVIGYMRESGSALTTAPQFIDSKTQKSVPFPLLFDAHDVTPASLSLSLIVPSYNEQERLPIMMEETLNYLTAKKKKDPSFTYEIIVVDDGSRDKTSQVALEFSRKHGSDVIRVMTLTKNVGKGGAVQQVSASIFAQFNVIFSFDKCSLFIYRVCCMLVANDC
jgi:cellulose synthase/poly-beta-1,6-N-acetylglucosamine synthase-like glycosyltransferase